MIKRRLVGGILSLVVACWELFKAYDFYQMYLSLRDGDLGLPDQTVIRLLNNTQKLFSSYLFYAGLALVVGIIFLATCKKQPVKWFDYTLFGVMLFFLFLLPIVYLATERSEFAYSLFAYTAIIQFCCYLLGAPGAKGFKDFPFKSKADKADA